MRTLGDRLRCWQDEPKLTELLNTPVQGTAADITKAALAKLPHAHWLLEFLVTELLKDHAAVKLWIDKDNVGAIALYRSVGSQTVGYCYTLLSQTKRNEWLDQAVFRPSASRANGGEADGFSYVNQRRPKLPNSYL